MFISYAGLGLHLHDINLFSRMYMIRVTFGASDLASPFFTLGAFLFSISFTIHPWCKKARPSQKHLTYGTDLMQRRSRDPRTLVSKG